MDKILPLDPDIHITLRITLDPEYIEYVKGFKELLTVVDNRGLKNPLALWRIYIMQDLYDLISPYPNRVIVYEHDYLEPHIMPWYFVLELQDITDDEFLMLKLSWL